MVLLVWAQNSKIHKFVLIIIDLTRPYMAIPYELASQCATIDCIFARDLLQSSTPKDLVNVLFKLAM